MTPSSPSSYRLMHEGVVALAAIEAAGMRIDVPYLERMLAKAEHRIAELSNRLRQSEVWQQWQRRFGSKATLGSRQQLGVILFDVLDLPCTKQTKSGRASTDEADLEATGHPFCKDYLQLEKLKKLHGTYLKGVLREVEGEYLHPFFNLHLVTSFRSSSDSPNFQNIPARDPVISSVIRRAFIPRPGHVLVEIDYRALEVRIACTYHQDPTMLTYIEANHDMHGDMAAECFLLDKGQGTKKTRFAGKNGFVFPAFYGDYYVGISKNLWSMIDRERIETADGTPIKKHLRSRGIRGFTEFEQHIKQVEERFWGQRFPVYDEWKRTWWAEYLEQGWFRLKTGFVCRGVYRRNEVTNLPVQGAAFHCLLWSLIRLHKWFARSRMRSAIIGQIHDSLVIDAHRDELQDVIGQARQIMTQDIRKEWGWINAPLEVEVEVGERNWFEKKGIE